nr:hypothetical protein [uncultured archaeon]
MSIEKFTTSKTSGSGDSISQVFVSNTIASSKQVVATSPFNFDVPVYTFSTGNNGATFNFYTQNTDGISASLNSIKNFTFNFSANTNSLSGTTRMKHDIYRIDYDTFTSTVPEIVLTAFTTTNIYSALTQPIYTVFEDTSGSTFVVNSAHTLTISQKIKPTGQYTQDLFVDKAQYFIDSTFVFDKSIDQTLGAVEMYSGSQIVQLYDMPISANTILQTSNNIHTITGGTFSGVSISGATFTFFTPPKKADIFVINGAPAVQGILNTFCPIMSFKNTEDGDSYKIAVTYNTGDTTFTGTTTTFNINPQPGNAEHIRTAAIVINPNSEFLYKIGNVKEIINLFGIKQNVTTWSEFVYAKASNDGTFEISGHSWINSINGMPLIGATITITVQSSLSSVDLGSDAVDDSSITSEITTPLGGALGTITTVTSDVNGYFTFGKMNGGQYTIVATPNNVNFSPITVSMFISADVNLDFVFSVLWGSTLINFSDSNNYTFL